MNGNWVEVILIFFMILLNGVFAMTEIALVSVRKSRIEQQAEDGDKDAKTALDLIESPNRFLSTVQVGISLVGVFAGALGGASFADGLAVWINKVPLSGAVQPCHCPGSGRFDHHLFLPGDW